MNLNDLPELREKLERFAEAGKELVDQLDVCESHGIQPFSLLNADRLRGAVKAAGRELAS